MTVAEIFDRAGEAAFREMETAAVRESAAREPIVLALGGGALEASGTRDLLVSLPGCVVVFLEAPLETLIARCSREAGALVRPVLADRGRLADRYSARLPWYRKAHFTVATTGMEPKQVAEQIAQWLVSASRDGEPAAAEGSVRITERSQPGVPA